VFCCFHSGALFCIIFSIRIGFARPFMVVNHCPMLPRGVADACLHNLHNALREVGGPGEEPFLHDVRDSYQSFDMSHCLRHVCLS
jgi:hypothetical protein